MLHRQRHTARACRAVMVQLGFYFHMKQALGAAQYTLTRPLAFAVGFMLFVSIVIALFKDIPDIQGDRQVLFERRAPTTDSLLVCVHCMFARQHSSTSSGPLPVCQVEL